MVYITTNYLEVFRNTYPSYILYQGEALYLMHLTHIEASPRPPRGPGGRERAAKNENVLFKNKFLNCAALP